MDDELPDCSGLPSSTDSSPSCSTPSLQEEEEEKIVEPEWHINFLGWEIFYRSIQHSLNKKSDILMAVVHWTLMLEKYTLFGIKPQYCCLQIYDATWNFGEFSEKLPVGWNNSKDYLFHYGYCGHRFDLHGHVVSVGILVIRFVSHKTQQQSYLCIDIEDTVATMYAPYGRIYLLIPSFVSFMNRVATELIYPVCYRENKRDKISQTVDYRTTKYYRSLRDNSLFNCDDVLAAQNEQLPYNPRERLTLLPREMYNRSSGLPKMDDVPEKAEQMKFKNYNSD